MRQLRLASGLVLFAFVFFHLVNHALGLISIETMEAMRAGRIAITRSTPGTAILVLAAIIHLLLGVEKFLSRRVSAIPMRDLVQLAFGVLIPLFLIRHIIGHRAGYELFGVIDNYEYSLWAMWPAEAWRQILLIFLVWVHSCIGLHMWLRFKPAFNAVKPVAFTLAVLIPVLAFAGFSVAGRKVQAAATYTNPYTGEQYQTLATLFDITMYISIAFIVALVSIKIVQRAVAAFTRKVSITYDDATTVSAPPGMTLLEISRANGIPHASICGGRARCSTCRVRILAGAEDLVPADDHERKVLQMVGIEDDNVRLACQIRPTSGLSVVALVPIHRQRARGGIGDKYDHGVERKVTLMFIDIRGFTRFSEKQLPYDVVFVLNQYMARMSDAIAEAGGYVDKYMGDGIMAIFGMEVSAEKGARQAIEAAAAVSEAVDGLNTRLRSSVTEPLKIGIGIHSGEAILGRVGASSSHSAGERITALGDTVNTASRLESLSKDLGAELVISEQALEAAGADLSTLSLKELPIRGRQTALRVLPVGNAGELSIPQSA